VAPVTRQAPVQRAAPQAAAQRPASVNVTQPNAWAARRTAAPQPVRVAPAQQPVAQPRRSPGVKRQAPTPPRQQPPRQRTSPSGTSPAQENKDYVAPHRRSGSITRTSTYMGAHGPQTIRGSRSLSRDAPRNQPQPRTRRSTSRDRPQRRRPQEAMPAQPMARNQSIPINNQSVYQHQPVTQQHRPPAPVAQPVNTACTVFITNLPATVSKAQFGACLQHNRIPCPSAMGKDRQHNLIWCTFSHPQYAETAFKANLWIQGVRLNVVRPQNAI